MGFIRLIFLSILFFLSSSVFSQSIDEIKLKLQTLSAWSDTNYVYRFPHRIVINPTFFIRTNTLILQDVDKNGEEVIYKPNSPLRLAFSGSYKWLTLGFSFRLPSYLNNKGNTESFALYLGTQTHYANWGLDFYFVKNKGYYLANPETVIENWEPGDKYIFRSDLETLDIGFSTHILLSHKISLKAALNQSEKQLKNAGGFAIQSGINYSQLNTDSTIIPISQQQFYNEASMFKNNAYVNINVRPGYAYTFVHDDFYATTFALVGIGLQFQSYNLGQEHDWGAQFMPQFKFQQIFGYNSDDAFVKLMFTYSTESYSMKDLKIRNKFMLLSLGGGLRLM